MILRELYAQPETSVYALLDGASVPDLREKLWEREPEHICLYSGELTPDMAEIAPYLIKLERVSIFTDWVLQQGWGSHWGIFAVTPRRINVKDLSSHFRRFLMVRSPEGKHVYFRYYDPRVLRLYLPTCNAEELDFVFGPVRSFMLEDENPAALLCFRRDGGELGTERIGLTSRQ